MTAKKVRCNRVSKKCVENDCPDATPHLPQDDCTSYGICDERAIRVRCIPVKPRKLSPAKPEKMWVVQEQRLNSKKWGVAMYRFNYPLAKKTLKEWRHHVPSRKFRLREYTAGKVLKD